MAVKCIQGNRGWGFERWQTVDGEAKAPAPPLIPRGDQPSLDQMTATLCTEALAKVQAQ